MKWDLELIVRMDLGDCRSYLWEIYQVQQRSESKVFCLRRTRTSR